MTAGSQATPPRPVARGNPSAPDARERVLACAAALLEESGPEGLTIRRLAAASGFTPPAIYSLFRDKAGLVDALVQRVFAQVAEAVGAVDPQTDPREYARASYLALVGYGHANPHQFRLLEERLPASAPMGPSLELWRDQMPTPLFASSSALGIDADLMRQIFWTLLHGLVTLPPLQRDIAWRDDLASHAFEALVEGLVRLRPAEDGTGD